MDTAGCRKWVRIGLERNEFSGVIEWIYAWEI